MRLKDSPEDFIVKELPAITPHEQGQHLLLWMVKRGMNTEHAIQEICRQLGVQRKTVGYAGSKDRNAVTEQAITIKGIDAGAISAFAHDRITLTVLGRATEQLRLGMLRGNAFRITARDLAKPLKPLARMPNYYDSQRFSTANAEIGRMLVKNDFAGAARRVIGTDEEWAARVEEWLTSHLNDAVGALRLLPQHTLLMYVHAYQSLLYNELLDRWTLHHDPGAILLEGDVPIRLSERGIPDMELPLIGFDTREDGLVGGWVDELLSREGLVPRDFVIRQIPFLTVEGARRAAFVPVADLELSPFEQEVQTASFSLPPGSYATIAMRCLARP